MRHLCGVTDNPYMLSVIMLSVFMLSVFMLSVIMLSVFMLSVFMLSVYMLSVTTLNRDVFCNAYQGAKATTSSVVLVTTPLKC
jgi:hypothetical protein